MTNSLAIGLGLALLAVLAANVAFGWELHVFLGRKLVDLIEWLAFWR
jgi:hypothetical protein